MIPAGELKLEQTYLDDAKAFALVRTFVKAGMSDVVLTHGLGRIPKQAYVVSAEGKALSCWFKVSSGAPVRDIRRCTLQFSAGSAIATVRIE